MQERERNLIQIHIAVLLFGLAGLFGKWIILPALIIVLGRVFFAALFQLFLLVFLKQKIWLKNGRDYAALAFLGAVLAIHWSAFFQAVQMSTVAVALLTFSTFPIFVTFLEPCLSGERIKLSDLAVAAVTFIGVALVIPSFSLSNDLTQGALWGILSGLSFALLSIVNKKYINKYGSLVITLHENLTATLLLLPFLFIIKPIFTSGSIALLILLGVVFTGISHSLFISGLRTIKAQTASIIASLEPVYGIAVAAVCLGELPSLKVILGGTIILGAAFYATAIAKGKK